MCILSKYKPYKVIFVSGNMLGFFKKGVKRSETGNDYLFPGNKWHENKL